MLVAQKKLDYEEPYYYDEEPIEAGLPKRKKTAPAKRALQAESVKLKSMAMTLAIIAMFGLIGAKTVHITVVKGAELKALEKEIQALEIENNLLQIEVDKLRSVARIEEVALAMGMEKPEGTLYIPDKFIQPEKEVGVEQTQQTAALPSEGKANSLMDSVFKIFTSFFASTQR
ncbi:MAG TPA: septum formation initiator [Peptococcaceae bacterium]|nr:septum formation initiator [Peptococcaceae bacterium]